MTGQKNPVELVDGGVWLFDGRDIVLDTDRGALEKRLGRERGAALAEARSGSIAAGILAAHSGNGGGPGDPAGEKLSLKFDSLASHDITFVNIIQTALACGLEKFPVPYILTNCHNSLCAVGGTINGDDHAFGLSAAQKYGGIFVPPHIAVIHSYVREAMAGGGSMILGSDSHTRYGALGTMGVGEGGGELVKQLLSQRYETAYPDIVGVELTGKPAPGVGPQDAALALVGAVFKNGFVKNAVLEFFGAGITGLSAEYRSGIDVMTTETACWSSIWETDTVIRDWLALCGRDGDYRELKPQKLAYYDRLIRVDLSALKPLIALPFHPSNVFEIDEVLANPHDILRQAEIDAAAEADGRAEYRLLDKIEKLPGGEYTVRIDQGIIAGCAGGTFENIMAAAEILKRSGAAGAGSFPLSVYPGSQSIFLEIARNGAMASLVEKGAIIRTAFCGPCFGAGDVPANGDFSVRHTTRNFPNREGSRPQDGQMAAVALMDARSVAASAAAGGILRSAASWPGIEEAEQAARAAPWHFDSSSYQARVYQGFRSPKKAVSLRQGPNITGWPPMEDLGEHLLVRVAALITDPVTTTDELIPSGETASYRSNPQALAAFTLSRKDPGYVGRARKTAELEKARQRGSEEGGDFFLFGESAAGDETGTARKMAALFAGMKKLPGLENMGLADLRVGSAIYARKPGDGSAREQAASCQKVLGGWANFAGEYATKRYRSNLINWGIVPFILPGEPELALDDFVFIPWIRKTVLEGKKETGAYLFRPAENPAGKPAFVAETFCLEAPVLSGTERDALLAGSLINLNRKQGSA